MKKYHLYLWLVALVGLMTSCSQDEVADALQTANESNRVTLTASLPGDFAQIGTRALPSVSDHQLRCILEVWTKDVSPVLKYREEKAGLSGDNVVFDFTIEEGTYDCLFWADFIATGATTEDVTIGSMTCTHYADKFYTTNNTDNGLRAISIIESAYSFNTDARDAFFGHYELKKKAAAVENPSIPALTRPFAKLTIKEKNATNYGYCSGLTAKYQVPTTFNVLDGTVGNTMAEVTCSSKSTDSPTLFSDYIFTDASSTLGSIALTFTGAASKELQPVTIPAGIPLKRNYKTNAAGSLISEKPAPTDGVKLTVTMDAKWTSPEIEHDIAEIWDGKYPASVEEAKEWMGAETSGADDATTAINHVFTITAARQLAALHYLMINHATMGESLNYENATYKLATDIDLNEKLWTPIGDNGNSYRSFPGIFDGQAHTISGLNISYTLGQYSGLFASIDNGGVIKNVMVKGSVAARYNGNGTQQVGGIAGQIKGGATIAFCSFEGTVSATQNSGSNIYIAGICGMTYPSAAGTITSCFTNTTPDVSSSSGSIYKGGILGRKVNSTVQGCTWYYNSGATPEGIQACYPDWTSGDEGNASYSNTSDLNNRLTAMNSYNDGYEYKWVVESGTLKLEPKN